MLVGMVLLYSKVQWQQLLGFSYVRLTLPYLLNTMIWKNGRVMLESQSVSGHFYPVEPLSCLHSAGGPLWDCDRKPADRYKG